MSLSEKPCARCKVNFNLMHKNWYGNDNTHPLCRICGSEDATELRNQRWKNKRKSFRNSERLMIKRMSGCVIFKKISSMPLFQTSMP